MSLTIGDLKILLADYVIDARERDIEIEKMKVVISGLEKKLAESDVPPKQDDPPLTEE
jgi:hypothetical protein